MAGKALQPFLKRFNSKFVMLFGTTLGLNIKALYTRSTKRRFAFRGNKNVEVIFFRTPPLEFLFVKIDFKAFFT